MGIGCRLALVLAPSLSNEFVKPLRRRCPLGGSNHQDQDEHRARLATSTMTSRKLQLPSGPPMLGPRPSIKTVKVSAEYSEALKVLSESTMKEACMLLQSDDNSDYDKLVEMYQKCRTAAAVVIKEAPADTPFLPTGPGARALAANRAQAKPLGAKSVLPPARRMARLPPATIGKRGILQRNESEGSMEKRPSVKKPRAAGPSVAAPRPKSPVPDASRPPPSALNFLAKLNNDKSLKKKAAEAAAAATPKASVTKKARAPSPPLPATRTQPTRTQPSRSSRK